MTIFMIHGRPHITAHNSFLELSKGDYHMLLEHGEIESVQEVEMYD